MKKQRYIVEIEMPDGDFIPAGWLKDLIQIDCDEEDEGRNKVTVKETSLPSNLDEAALKAYPKMSRLSEPHGVIPADNKTHYLGDANEENRVAFKAGAEWMAGQGINTDFEVCKLANRAWLTSIDEKKFAQDIFDNFAAGDEVVVQIRKKD